MRPIFPESAISRGKRNLLAAENHHFGAAEIAVFTQPSGAEQFRVSVHPNVSICAVSNLRLHRGSENAPRPAGEQGPSDGSRLIAENHTNRTQPAMPSPSSPVPSTQRSGSSSRRVSHPSPLPKVHCSSDNLPPDSDPTHGAQNATPQPPPTSPSLSLHSAPSTPRAPPVLGIQHLVLPLLA